MNKVICIIPARGGSKGLPRKNVALLYGHPLIAWPIAAAKRSKLVNKIIVATDDDEISRIAIRYGAEVPFLRPSSISDDLTTTEETLEYSIRKAEDIFDIKFDIGVFLTCTDIFRKVEWIDSAVQSLIDHPELESSFAVNKTHKNFWQWTDNRPATRLADWMRVYSNRQVRTPIYREDTGLCCASRATLWRQGKRIGDRVKLITDDRSECAIDVHNKFDLYLAECAMQWLSKNDPDNMPPIPEVVL